MFQHNRRQSALGDWRDSGEGFSDTLGYVFTGWIIMRRTVAVFAMVVVPACACACVVTGGAAAVTAEDTEITRSLSVDAAEPGETVTVTKTAELSDEGALDLVEDFSPAFGDVDLLSVTEDGQQIAPNFLDIDDDSIILSFFDVGPSTLEIRYNVTVPDDAEFGDTYTFEGTAQFQEEPVPVEGDDTLHIGDGVDPAAFEVGIDSIPESVSAGESVEIGYTVENVGDKTATQELTTTVDGGVVDTEAFELAGGETANGVASYETDRDDVPAVTVDVASEDDTATETVEILEPESSFEVTISEFEDTVVAGENVTVDAVVTNEGEAEATREIDFSVGGNDQDSETVTLGEGESETVSFVYESVADDVPSLELLVTSADDEAAGTVEVLQPASFDIVIEQIEEEVAIGETVTVEATVTNQGDVEATQAITLAVDDEQRDSKELTLAAGANETLTFTLRAGDDDPVQLDIELSSMDDVVTETVRVAGERLFAVTADVRPDTVQAGETLVVEYTVENVGEHERTRTVSVTASGTELINEEVTLGAGQTVDSTVEYTTSEADAPGVTVSVTSGNDTAEETVPVATAASLTVVDIDPQEPVVAGETLPVNLTVANDAETTITGPVGLVVTGTDGERLDATEWTVTVGAGEMEQLSVAYQTGDGDPPAVVLSGETEGDETDPVEVTVAEPAEAGPYDVTVEAEDSVAPGEALTVAYDVTNTGDAEGNVTVTFIVDDVELGSELVTVAPGGSVTGTFTHTVTDSEVASIDAAVTTGEETATVSVAVEDGDDADGTGAEQDADDDGTGFGVLIAGMAVLALAVHWRHRVISSYN